MSEIQENTEARLATYIDGELEGAERAEIEKLLEQHPNYRRVLEQLRQTRDLLSGLPRETAPPELSEAFNGQLERTVLLEGISENRRRGAAARGLPQFAAIAAILILTAGLGVAVYFALPQGKSPTQFADVRLRSTASPAGSATDDDGPLDEVVPPVTADRDNNIVTAAPAVSDPPGIAPGAAATTSGPARVAPAMSVAATAPDAGSVAAAAPPSVLRAVGGGGGSGGFGGGAARAMVPEIEGAAKSGLADSDSATRLLAQNVYQNAQVQDLLKNAAVDSRRNANLAGNLAPQTQNDAVVVVVRSANTAELNREMLAYFGSNDISWEAMSPETKLALNNTLSNFLFREKLAEDTPASNLAMNTPRAPEAGKNLNDGVASKDKQSVAKRAEVSTPGVNIDKLERADSAKAMSAAPATQPSPLPQFEERPQMLDQLRPVDSVYVARRVSPRQATDLNATLSRRGHVQQTPMVGGEFDQVAATDNSANNLSGSANSPRQVQSVGDANSFAANRARSADLQQQQPTPQPANGARRGGSAPAGSVNSGDRSTGNSVGGMSQQLPAEGQRGGEGSQNAPNLARNSQANAPGRLNAPSSTANGSNKEVSNSAGERAFAGQAGQQNRMVGNQQNSGLGSTDVVNLIIVVQKDPSAVAGFGDPNGQPQSQPAGVKNNSSRP